MRRAQVVLDLDEVISGVVTKLKEKGLLSAYLKAFVVARVDPTRFSKAAEFDFDEVLGKMTASARRFNVDKIRAEDLAHSGGALEAEE